MKIIRNNILPPKGFKAITILCFIFVKKGIELDDNDIRHETIHWEQEKELLFIGFYVLYLLDFLRNLLKFGDWSKAYRNICFEREAYANQTSWFYPEARNHYSWIKYITI